MAATKGKKIPAKKPSDEKGKKKAKPQEKKHLFTKEERDWVLYDVGIASLSMFNTVIAPIYANTLGEAFFGGAQANAESVATWGITQTVASLIVALLMPILGSLADYKGQKIKFFATFTLIGILACFAQVLPLTFIPYLAVFVIIIVGYNSVRTFYDSMLVDVTTDERMNTVSSMGFGIGYIAGVVPFVICIAFIFLGPTYLGFDTEFWTRFGFVISALWWFCFAIPLLKNYKQKYGKKRKDVTKEIKKTFTGLKKTMQDIAKDRRLLYFMLAYFFYIDAVFTVIAMATNYGSSLGIDNTHLIFALLATQFVAFPATILFGLLANKFGERKMIIVAIFGYIGIVLFGTFFLTGPIQFWILALLTGLFMGGAQAISRSFFGKIIPKKRSNEYFGFYKVFGAFARVLGTGLVALFTLLTGRPSVGVFSIMILLVFGLVFMLLMPRRGLEGTEEVK